jgi:hypothetical protein
VFAVAQDVHEGVVDCEDVRACRTPPGGAGRGSWWTR